MAKHCLAEGREHFSCAPLHVRAAGQHLTEGQRNSRIFFFAQRVHPKNYIIKEKPRKTRTQARLKEKLLLCFKNIVLGAHRYRHAPRQFPTEVSGKNEAKKMPW